MSAELLRKAATILRERAERVPAAPWFAMMLNDPVSLSRAEPGEWMVDSESRLIAGNISLDGDPNGEGIAPYIATMGPDVGIALAELLEYVADRHDRHSVGLAIVGKANNLARLIVGEQA